MNWFERHLNWTLLLGLIYIPFNIGFTVGIILSIILIIVGLASYGFTSEALHYLAGAEQTLGETTNIIVGVIILISLLIAVIRFGFWFLDRKGRGRGYVAWLVVPPFLGIPIAFLSAMFLGSMGVIIGFTISFLGPIVGLIILLLLENRALRYGGDFDSGIDTDLVHEAETGGLPYTGPYIRPDDRQLKELDYTPSQSVLDISDSLAARDVKPIMEVKDIGDVSSESVAGEAAPAPEKVIERAVSQERLKQPLLLDDTGAVIRCFYHPGADAVNMCSRCNQYVCSACSYITGTHPICRNCWERRAEVPVAPPAQKVSSAPRKAEKPKTAGVAKPEIEEVKEPSQSEVQVPVELTQPAEPPGPTEVGTAGPGQQKVAAPAKSAKLDAEKSQWQQEFMALYGQASSIINVVIRKSADGTPASPLDLMEGLKLRPMLERAKKMSKPKDKELREAKSEFEQVLSSCIKIADTAADFVSGGGQALLGGPDFKRIVDGIETANGIMEKLSQRLTSFSQPQEQVIP